MGSNDREERTRRLKRPRSPESVVAHDETPGIAASGEASPAPDAAAHEESAIPPRPTGWSGLPPGIHAESLPEPTHHPDEDAGQTAAEAVGPIADSDAVPSDRAYSGQPPSQIAPQYDRFGWPIPESVEPDESARRPAPPPGPYSGQFPTQEPAPNQSPRGPYSGQFPTQPPPQQSGAFPTVRGDERAYRSGAFPIPPASDVTRSGQFPAPPAMGSPDDRRSGQFPIAPADPVSQSGAYAVPPSGPIRQSPYTSGPMPYVGEQPGAARQSGSFAYPSEVTSTGSRRVIVAPDAGVGSLLADRPALAFLLAAVILAGAMIAFIALRYTHFPNQIALHFGPAGSSQPNRIGEKRELWTIPFIVGIVLAANTALAWAVYRYDRFAARLLTLGCALIAAIAWVVLLTLLHR
jgi:hypothetical protein